MNAIGVVLLLLAGFGDVFDIRQVLELPEKRWVSSRSFSTYRQYCCVDPGGGQVVLVDPREREIVAFDLQSGIPETPVARTDASVYDWGPVEQRGDTLICSSEGKLAVQRGSRSCEVNMPIAVRFDATGKLMVSDLHNRRISVFGDDYNFEHSFLLPPQLGPASDVVRLTDSTYLLSSPKPDTLSALNTGFSCHILTARGEIVESFAYTPESAIERNLWFGVHALVEIDDSGSIYVGFTTEPKVHVFDKTGTYLRTFGEERDWWVPPPVLQKPNFVINKPPNDFDGSWTRMVKLVCTRDNRLIVAFEANGLVRDCEGSFILDVYEPSGEFLGRSICCEALPVGVDSQNNIYFLSDTGDRILRTTFKE